MYDDPTENVQEHLQHTAVHGDHHDEAPAGHEHGHEHDHGGHGHSSRWITAAALTAAILAAFAAISGALSTSHLTESTHKRIDANDQWSYYQAKSIKSSNIDTRLYMAQLAHVAPSKKDIAKKAEYEEELSGIKVLADKLVKISDQHVEIHETYETAETLFHIAIAIVAIAVVAKRRSFWYVSIAGGFIGLLFFGRAYFHPIDEIPAETTQSASESPKPQSPKAEAEHPHAPEQTAHPATAP